MRAPRPADPLLVRLATATCPLFPAFGIAPRAHWTMALLPLALFAGLSTAFGASAAAAWAAAWTVALTAVIWTHEAAHAGAARSAGIDGGAVVLHPLGAFMHDRPVAQRPRHEAAIALAGPMSHAIWFVLAGTPYLLAVQGTPADDAVGGAMLRAFLAVSLSLLFLNLLPFWPLDGGRILRAVFAARIARGQAALLTAWLGFAGAAILGIVGVAMIVEAPSGSALAGVCGPTLVLVAAAALGANRRLLAEATWGAPAAAVRDAQWRSGIPSGAWSAEDDTPAEPVVVEERRPAERRTRAAAEPARRRETARPAARPLHERIDELLDRMNEVGGMENLSDAERAELRDASERLKRGDR